MEDERRVLAGEVEREEISQMPRHFDRIDQFTKAEQIPDVLKKRLTWWLDRLPALGNLSREKGDLDYYKAEWKQDKWEYQYMRGIKLTEDELLALDEMDSMVMLQLGRATGGKDRTEALLLTQRAERRETYKQEEGGGGWFG